MELNLRLTKVMLYTAVALSIAILLISLMLGDSKDPVYFWGVLAVLPLAGLSLYLYSRLAHLKRVKAIQEMWGKEDPRKRDFKSISHYYRKVHTESSAMVDDTTWNDLNMDQLFARIDRTLTGPGESVLYSLLRTPCTPDKKEELLRRDAIVTMLQTDAETREKLQLALAKMGRGDSSNLTHLLWEQRPPRNPLAFIYTMLAVAALLALISPIFLGTQGILIIMAVFGVNTTIHYRISTSFAHQIPSITSLAQLLKTAQTISRLHLSNLGPEQQMLKNTAKSGDKILRRTRYLFPDAAPSSDLLFALQYIKILFLMEIRSFYGALEEINNQIDELREVFHIVGLLDAMQSVASYRKDLTYTTPVFTSDPCLIVVGIRHPLLSNPVPNSISIQEQGILITGSNMAGKSTFLRTLGVNVIMAQTIYTCLANTYRASFLQVASSINKADDISQQKSLYYAEAERLLNIIRPEYLKLPALYIIDELLSGTNYTERLSASAAILNYLKTKNALVVVATHDLDLAENLGGAYQCYHFSDKVDKTNLEFDYSLKRGIATTRNAIKLLEHLGYPREIIEQANKI